MSDLNLQVITCNPLLEPLEELTTNHVYSDRDPKVDQQLSKIVEPIISSGCSYTAWEAALMLCRAAGKGMSFPNRELFEIYHQMIYDKCGLSDFTAEDLSDAMNDPIYNEIKLAKIEEAKRLKDQLKFDCKHSKDGNAVKKLKKDFAALAIVW